MDSIKHSVHVLPIGKGIRWQGHEREENYETLFFREVLSLQKKLSRKYTKFPYGMSPLSHQQFPSLLATGISVVQL